MSSVEERHFARKQRGSRTSIIRWSHAARFRQRVKLAMGLSHGRFRSQVWFGGRVRRDENVNARFVKHEVAC
jgi:hypothetical protein